MDAISNTATCAMRPIYQMRKRKPPAQPLPRGKSTLNMKKKTQHKLLPANSVPSGGPGSLYQIDAASANVLLTHSLDPGIILGRPAVYLAVDDFSRMIAGVYVTCQLRSYADVGAVLWNAFRDKVEWCKELDMTISQSDWPTSGLPQTVMCGREFSNFSPDSLVTELGVAFSNHTAYRPYLNRIAKALVKAVEPEADNGSIKQLPKSSAVSLRCFVRLLVAQIMVYNQGIQRNLPLTQEMVRDGLEPRPLNLWVWGINHISAVLRTLPEERVRIALLPRTQTAVTPSGLSCNGLLYFPSSPATRSALEQTLYRGPQRLTVHYDPLNVDRIYVLVDGSNEIEVFELVPRCGAYHGMSWQEFHRFQRIERKKAVEAAHCTAVSTPKNKRPELIKKLVVAHRDATKAKRGFTTTPNHLDDKAHFKEAIERFYIRAKLPFTVAYRRMLKQFYTQQDGCALSGHIPTFAQFRYYYRRHYPAKVA